MPFVDVSGSTGAAEPSQIGAIAAKVGVTIGLTVTVSIVVAVAHWPAAGVKVYVVVPVANVLMVEGLHIPVMPLLDTSGNTGATAFTQSGPIAVNAGVICASIVILNEADVAHWPASGVKV